MNTFFFLVFAFFALVCALNVVLQRHPISSALSLVGVMSSLAVLYLLLGAEFLAMAQVIVYAGAVMVLFIFVIMLLNAAAETRTGTGASVTAQLLGIPGLLAFFASIVFFVTRQYPNSASVRFGDFAGGGAREIGNLIFTSYLLPFEVTSILILIGIIGAIVLARKELD